REIGHLLRVETSLVEPAPHLIGAVARLSVEKTFELRAGDVVAHRRRARGAG
ncbi:MAG: hypothetical protein QOD49_2792, partial [Actinomycetota bacterium]|nr:hypothetical protein [Actinomycetota bacterium]